MTRDQALETARANHIARMAEYVKELRRDPSNRNMDTFDAKSLDAYGYRHGWYKVGEFNFSTEEITGQPYDLTQGGWAYL